MAKTRQQKEASVAQVVKMLEGAKGAVFVDFTGLKVKEISELRRNLREQQIEYEVVKKSLLKKVLEQVKLEGVSVEQFSGSVSLATSPADEVAAARIIAAFAKTHDKMAVLGGLMDKSYINIERVKALANLPGRQELLGQVVGTVSAPVSDFLRVLAGNLRGLVQVISALSKKA
ncbi:MAG: 50S ribosomal protein L10 [Patescibacteria group bacterium]